MARLGIAIGVAVMLTAAVLPGRAHAVDGPVPPPYDPVIGDYEPGWTISGGNGSYMLSYAKLMGACPKPPGTLQATFSGSDGSYTGQWAWWWTDTCALAAWGTATMTASPDGSLLTWCLTHPQNGSVDCSTTMTRAVPTARFTATNVTPANKPPTLTYFDVQPRNGLVNETSFRYQVACTDPDLPRAVFDFDGSKALPSADIIDYWWDFGETPFSGWGIGQKVSHTYQMTKPKQSWKVTLWVQHKDKAWHKLTKTVSATNPALVTKVHLNYGDFADVDTVFDVGPNRSIGASYDHIFDTVGLKHPTAACSDALGAKSAGVAGPELNVGVTVTNPKLKNRATSGFNQSGYTPVPGDFNGDGYDDIYWYSAVDGDVLWKGKANATFVAVSPRQISGQYIPVPGDFNGDHVDDIYWYAPGATAEVFWHGSTTGFTVATAGSFARTCTPVVGDFNGDGRDDIYWYGIGTIADSFWLGTAAGGFQKPAAPAMDGAFIPAAADFNGDHVDDIYWYAPGADAEQEWLGGPGGVFTPASPKAMTKTFAPLPGDYNADGNGDIYWYAAGTTADALWSGAHDNSFTKVAALAQDGTFTPATGDFNGDGRTDIYWYDPGPNADQLFLGNG